MRAPSRFSTAASTVTASFALACSGAALEGDAGGHEPSAGREQATLPLAFVDVERSRSVETVRRPTNELTPSSQHDTERALDEGTVEPGARDAEFSTDDEVVETLEAGHAIAHFIAAPTSAPAVLEMIGLAPSVPLPGRCNRRHDLSSTPLASVPELQLLDAGEVRILAQTTRGAAAVVSLAPRAFPSVSSFVSGVVYTSRDRSAPLIGATRYTVEVGGGQQIGPVTFSADAPAELSDVTLNGLPLGRVVEISANAPLDLTWNVGAPGDIVYVDVESSYGDDTVDGTRNDGVRTEPGVRCAFPDDAGSGSIALEQLSDLLGAGRVTVHRLRVVQRDLPADRSNHGAIRRAEVRFNFELTRRVSFID